MNAAALQALALADESVEGWVKALVFFGVGLGVGLGIWGTWVGYTKVEGSHEKVTYRKVSFAIFIGVGTFLVLMQVVPAPHNMWLWLLYGPGLVLGIRRSNEALMRARARDEAEGGGGDA